VGCTITQVATLCNHVKCDSGSTLLNRLFVNNKETARFLLQESRQSCNRGQKTAKNRFSGATKSLSGRNL